ncbi:MAG: helix-turn-helix transcriptional regulator [Lachnospiraceae bacterium]|nr:helix-turn-helix transcriptional regulator [Lachnospiraceae bacterium]
MRDFLHYSTDPDLWKQSGSRIAERRKALGLSKIALADRISEITSCDRQTVSAWEHGKAPINKLIQLGAVCKILECDPEYITCQCDTLRKQFADPAARFGLSEQALEVLEAAPGPEGFSSVVDFVLCSENVRQAFRSLLWLYETLPEKGTGPDPAGDDAHVIFTGGFDGVIMQKTDFYTDPFGQYVVQPEQARYIAEQQLIAEVRKALEK